MNIRPLSLEAYQQLIQVSLRQEPASVWFKDVQYLNVYTGQVERGHICLSGQRIAYVGDKEPLVSPQTEIVELDDQQIIVPGYIEPHAHPYQLYNPVSLGDYFLTQGTTVSMNDNVQLFACLDINQAIQFIDKLDQYGPHLWLWWCRVEAKVNLAQADEQEEESSYSQEDLQKWLAHPLVVQGGEVSTWPQLLQGHSSLAEGLLMTRYHFDKRIEGHLPGASFETLNAMVAAGIGCDHEALNGEDVFKRLKLGLYATLRYSSIRPDLPLILKEIKDNPSINLSRIMLTNDGSIPFFLEESGCNQMVKMVMDAGFEAVDAYRMVTLNPATYYGLDQELGGIAPGRLAHINVLNDLSDPTPVHVMVDGKWAIRDRQPVYQRSSTAWQDEFFQPLKKSFSLQAEMLAVETGTTGLELINEVITRPYTYDPQEALAENELYISMVSKQGEWVLNTRIKNYGFKMKALASTYTSSRDILLFGQKREHMIEAFNEALALGGGIVAYFENGEKVTIPLAYEGDMSTAPMAELIRQTNDFVQKIKEHGFPYEDPVYTLLFLTGTHLPFVRLTDQGVCMIKGLEIVSPVHRL